MSQRARRAKERDTFSEQSAAVARALACVFVERGIFKFYRDASFLERAHAVERGGGGGFLHRVREATGCANGFNFSVFLLFRKLTRVRGAGAANVWQLSGTKKEARVKRLQVSSDCSVLVRGFFGNNSEAECRWEQVVCMGNK